jgi:hypothetical protein
MTLDPVHLPATRLRHRHAAVRSLTSALVLLVAACAERATGPLLHELPAFAGEIEIEIVAPGTPQAPARYDLAFSRHNDHFAAQFATGGRVITMLAVRGSELEVFEDARVRPATAVEQERFALVRDLIDPKAVERCVAAADHYQVWRRGGCYTVRLAAQPAGFHAAPGAPGAPGAHAGVGKGSTSGSTSGGTSGDAAHGK